MKFSILNNNIGSRNGLSLGVNQDNFNSNTSRVVSKCLKYYSLNNNNQGSLLSSPLYHMQKKGNSNLTITIIIPGHIYDIDYTVKDEALRL